MVAVGNLDNIWSEVPEDATEKEFQHSFRSYFGAEFDEVLDTSDKSFAYISYNDTYFTVSNLQPMETLTLEQLIEKKKDARRLNIIVG